MIFPTTYKSYKYDYSVFHKFFNDFEMKYLQNGDLKKKTTCLRVKFNTLNALNLKLFKTEADRWGCTLSLQNGVQGYLRK